MQYVKYHNVYLAVPVRDAFIELANLVSTSIGIVIQPVDGFKSRPQIVNELKMRIKSYDPEKNPGLYTSDPYITSLSPDSFEPPLAGNRFSERSAAKNEIVATIPNYPNIDPRITGRIVKIGPKNLINPTLLYFLTHNAGKYGFVHYGPRDPSVWYWRGDKSPYIYTPEKTVTTFTRELEYLL